MDKIITFSLVLFMAMDPCIISAEQEMSKLLEKQETRIKQLENFLHQQQTFLEEKDRIQQKTVSKLQEIVHIHQKTITELQEQVHIHQKTITKLQEQVHIHQKTITELQEQGHHLAEQKFSSKKNFKDDEHVLQQQNKRLLLDVNGQLPGFHREGAMYIRWGRKECPNATELVYSGFAGGSHYTHSGGAAEYVCLPPDPEFGVQQNVGAYGYIYGAEYETNYFGPAEDQDVPCAVCRSLTGTSVVMIPAKSTCYPNWKREYHGRLASGYNGHSSASQYVCVDETPEAVIGGNSNSNGKLFYPVKAECGSLECPPYQNDKEVLCVVCTR